MKSPWTGGLPGKLYVVQAEATKHTVPGPNSYTVSPSPEVPGWETDGGEDGYGLPLEVAEEIVRRYNPEAERLEVYEGTAGECAIRALESAGGGPLSTTRIIQLMEEQGYVTTAANKYATVYAALRKEDGRADSRVMRTASGWRLRGHGPRETSPEPSPKSSTPEGGKSEGSGT